VRAVWPGEWPLLVRLSATDWAANGWTIEDTVQVSRRLRELGAGLIDVSSDGTLAQATIPVVPGYQTVSAARVRHEGAIPTSAVGVITEAVQAEHTLHTGQADLVMLARGLLRDLYGPLHAAKILAHDLPWPVQYARAAHGRPSIRTSDL